MVTKKHETGQMMQLRLRKRNKVIITHSSFKDRKKKTYEVMKVAFDSDGSTACRWADLNLKKYKLHQVAIKIQNCTFAITLLYIFKQKNTLNNQSSFKFSWNKVIRLSLKELWFFIVFFALICIAK